MDVTIIAKKLDLSGGGSDYSLDLLARQLHQREHGVRVVVLDGAATDVPHETVYDLVVADGDPIRNRIDILRRAYRQFERFESRTDVFHLFPPAALPAAGFYRQSGTVPVVGRLNTHSAFCVNFSRMDGECHQNCTAAAKFRHDGTSAGRRVLKSPLFISQTYLEPKLMASVDQFFAISPSVAEIYADIGLPEEKIDVVPNFYDPSFTTNEGTVASAGGTAECDSSTSSGLDLLYVGRLERVKGVEVLLQAVKQVESASVEIVGDGSRRDELVSLARDEGIDGRVTFHGRVDHDRLPAYYRSADVFVHPGRWPEPFGRTLLETMQCRTPAIVTDIGAPPWVVGDAGRVVPPEAPTALAEGIRSLRGQEIRARLSKQCPERVAEFDPETVVSRIESGYDAVCSDA